MVVLRLACALDLRVNLLKTCCRLSQVMTTYITMTSIELSHPNKKKTLELKLNEYQDDLRSKSHGQVLYPNIFVEFGPLQIDLQVNENRTKLFSVPDIMNCVEIWRKEYTHDILKIFLKIFGDIDELPVELDDSNLDDTLDTDWLENRDDSSANVLVFQDSSLFQVSQERMSLIGQ